MIISLILGALTGWIAGQLMHTKGGILRNILLGIAGSAVGTFLAGTIGLAATGWLGSMIIGVAGACVVILVARWLFK